MSLTYNEYITLLQGIEGKNLTERLDILLDYKKITKKQFSDESEIPYPTVIGFYQKGMESIKLSTLKKICDYFVIPMNYFTADNHEWSQELLMDDLLDFVKNDRESRAIIGWYQHLEGEQRETARKIIHVLAGAHMPALEPDDELL